MAADRRTLHTRQVTHHQGTLVTVVHPEQELGAPTGTARSSSGIPPQRSPPSLMNLSPRENVTEQPRVTETFITRRLRAHQQQHTLMQVDHNLMVLEAQLQELRKFKTDTSKGLPTDQEVLTLPLLRHLLPVSTVWPAPPPPYSEVAPPTHNNPNNSTRLMPGSLALPRTPMTAVLPATLDGSARPRPQTSHPPRGSSPEGGRPPLAPEPDASLRVTLPASALIMSCPTSPETDLVNPAHPLPPANQATNAELLETARRTPLPPTPSGSQSSSSSLAVDPLPSLRPPTRPPPEPPATSSRPGTQTDALPSSGTPSPQQQPLLLSQEPSQRSPSSSLSTTPPLSPQLSQGLTTQQTDLLRRAWVTPKGVPPITHQEVQAQMVQLQRRGIQPFGPQTDITTVMVVNLWTPYVLPMQDPKMVFWQTNPEPQDARAFTVYNKELQCNMPYTWTLLRRPGTQKRQFRSYSHLPTRRLLWSASKTPPLVGTTWPNVRQPGDNLCQNILPKHLHQPWQLPLPRLDSPRHFQHERTVQSLILLRTGSAPPLDQARSRLRLTRELRPPCQPHCQRLVNFETRAASMTDAMVNVHCTRCLWTHTNWITVYPPTLASSKLLLESLSPEGCHKLEINPRIHNFPLSLKQEPLHLFSITLEPLRNSLVESSTSPRVGDYQRQFQQLKPHREEMALLLTPACLPLHELTLTVNPEGQLTLAGPPSKEVVHQVSRCARMLDLKATRPLTMTGYKTVPWSVQLKDILLLNSRGLHILGDLNQASLAQELGLKRIWNHPTGLLQALASMVQTIHTGLDDAAVQFPILTEQGGLTSLPSHLVPQHYLQALHSASSPTSTR